ncbi:MAG TPA: SusC/RagA family TonB-linked outer membrane protein [Bacteroidales bacterium]|nr:SusC/RagA family TonB-linked outer membrane protein [Bacteroidales bacterium]HPI69008.1 SusC/RagA family TonB-linked outer membrane protein [Bacteroidales bacterium]
MKKLFLLIVLFVFAGSSILLAQTRVITGTVSSATEGEGVIPGVTVQVKGTTLGTITDQDGKYSISVPANATTLVFSYIGMKKQEVEIAGRSVIDAAMESDLLGLDEVVVTALGISRERKSLGYSVQEVGGDNISKTKESNFVNSLSGKISGVQIMQSNTMGGSANVLIRGHKSLMNSNQALFVVDGVPIDNSITNTSLQTMGGGGYDYGNAASDINPDDIESMSVLKGAAATALYGSRAANGVIMITTKKGTARKGIGVTVNAGLIFSKIDKNTLPDIQKEYGGGYGQYYDDESGYFWIDDLDGDGTDDLIVPTSEDAAWGAKFDPDIMVIDWVGFEPTDHVNYLRKVPWVAGEHDLSDFFETGLKQNYNIAFDGGNEKGSFRLSYTNLGEAGILPNSELKKNTINFAGSYNLTDKLSVESNVTYVNDKNKGRYGTGYDPGNPMQSLGQWFQPNVDIYDLKKYWITEDRRQRTWNYAYYDDIEIPIYHNNIYWTRYMNYQNDGRDRMFGYGKVAYELTSWLSLEGRVSTDFYSEYQEERVAVYSNQTSDYTKYLRTFSETNLDLMARFNREFGNFSLNGLLGVNRRRNDVKSTNGSTVGGLLIPEFYDLMNSSSPITTTETEQLYGVNSVFGQVSLGYQNMLYIDLTGRNDKSSTLPEENNSYFYPSVSTSFIVSELPGIKGSNLFSFLKLRLNYAEVGNDAPVYSLLQTYTQMANYGTQGVFRVSDVLQNPDLRPERTKSWEGGIEAKFLQNRFGFDLALYRTLSVDQIMPVSISPSSGFSQRYVNSGEIENKGIELALNATLIQSRDFTWDVQVNWFRNKNTVLDLYEGVENIQLASEWDLSVNIVKGMSYGQLRGTDFVYTDGKRTVDEDGWMLISDASDVLIGSVLPDWNAGITTFFDYKGITLSALVDISKGGNLYSTDLKYGLATGLFAETAGLNEKGTPVRQPASEGGGYLYPNTVHADGSPNETYVDCYDYFGAFLYDFLPTAYHVHDASYVKLREISLGYNLPSRVLANTPLSRVTLSVVGRNLWLIHKNMPYYDPELSLSAGNIQGFADGAYPATRTIGFNVTVGF